MLLEIVFGAKTHVAIAFEAPAFEEIAFEAIDLVALVALVIGKLFPLTREPFLISILAG